MSRHADHDSRRTISCRLGARLKAYRLSHDLTQEALAAHLRLSIALISQLERGLARLSERSRFKIERFLESAVVRGNLEPASQGIATTQFVHGPVPSTGGTAVGSTESFESAEMAWLITNRDELEGFRGQWLLIAGEELIAHSPDFREIRKAIAERGIQSPFVYYVPTPEEANFIAG
jgi:transcriptional regulator with XRE-family HTH domain